MDKKLFSKILSEELTKRNITQVKLAELCDLTEVTISRYVNGSRLPNIEALDKIATVLNVRTDYLLGRDYESTDNDQLPIHICSFKDINIGDVIIRDNEPDIKYVVIDKEDYHFYKGTNLGVILDVVEEKMAIEYKLLCESQESYTDGVYCTESIKRLIESQESSEISMVAKAKYKITKTEICIYKYIFK